MVKREITYVDFDGVERTEDFYFNFTKAELMDMELSVDGGLSAKIKKIFAAKDVPSLIAIFKEILLKSYGEKSDDGRLFVKGPDISNRFASTNAFSDMYMKMATDDKYAADFINALLPEDGAIK